MSIKNKAGLSLLKLHMIGRSVSNHFHPSTASRSLVVAGLRISLSMRLTVSCFFIFFSASISSSTEAMVLSLRHFSRLFKAKSSKPPSVLLLLRSITEKEIKNPFD